MREERVILERVVDVHSSNEWCEPVSAARIGLTRAAIERILMLSDLAQQHSLASVREYNYTPEWGFRDDEDEFVSTYDAGDRNTDGPFRSEGNQMAVYPSVADGFVLWTAYWKHSEIKVCTDYVWLSELRAALSGSEAGLSLKDTHTTEQIDG